MGLRGTTPPRPTYSRCSPGTSHVRGACGTLLTDMADVQEVVGTNEEIHLTVEDPRPSRKKWKSGWDSPSLAGRDVRRSSPESRNQVTGLSGPQEADVVARHWTGFGLHRDKTRPHPHPPSSARSGQVQDLREDHQDTSRVARARSQEVGLGHLRVVLEHPGLFGEDLEDPRKFVDLFWGNLSSPW